MRASSMARGSGYGAAAWRRSPRVRWPGACRRAPRRSRDGEAGPCSHRRTQWGIGRQDAMIPMAVAPPFPLGAEETIDDRTMTNLPARFGPG